MFTLSHFKFGKLSATKIQHHKKGIELEIIHDFGAIINKYSVNQSPFSFIRGYESYSELIETHPFFSRSAKLFPFPNRLEHGRFRYDQKSYTLPANFPWTDDAVHGLLYNQAFSVVHSHCETDFAELTLRFETSSLAKGFPFSFTLDVSYRVDTEGVLVCSTKVTNTGNQAFPFGDAWHPYFSLDCTLNQVQMTMPVCKELQVESGLPTGERREFKQFRHGASLTDVSFNHCFEFDGHATANLCLQRLDQTATLHFQQDSSYPFVQLYTPPSEATLAIEPMTCPANAFNNQIGLIDLLPGQTRLFRWQCQAHYIPR